jgi:hypothetical protein
MMISDFRNLKDGVLEVPLKKMIKMRDKISFVLQEKSTTARILAGVVGKIIYLIPVLGSVCQLMTRNSIAIRMYNSVLAVQFNKTDASK